MFLSGVVVSNVAIRELTSGRRADVCHCGLGTFLPCRSALGPPTHHIPPIGPGPGRVVLDLTGTVSRAGLFAISGWDMLGLFALVGLAFSYKPTRCPPP